jgi:hypothetical protein
MSAIVEELRVTTEDMQELMKRANERSETRVRDAKTVLAQSRALRARARPGQKR